MKTWVLESYTLFTCCEWVISNKGNGCKCLISLTVPLHFHYCLVLVHTEDDKEGLFPEGGASSAQKGGLMESESFMNALSSQAVRKVEKRAKKVSKSSGGVVRGTADDWSCF